MRYWNFFQTWNWRRNAGKTQRWSWEGRKSSKRQEESTKEIIAKRRRTSSSKWCSDVRHCYQEVHDKISNLDRFSTSDNKAEKHSWCEQWIGSLEEDLSSIEWSTSADKIRKILGETSLHGKVHKNRSGWQSSSGWETEIVVPNLK